MYSSGSLNGAASNPMLPGEFESMNPKSMWIRCPSRSSKMLPLCRSLICRRYVTSEYPASDFAKLRCARTYFAEAGSP